MKQAIGLRLKFKSALAGVKISIMKDLRNKYYFVVIFIINKIEPNKNNRINY